MEREIICFSKQTTEVMKGLKVRSVILSLAVLKLTYMNEKY